MSIFASNPIKINIFKNGIIEKIIVFTGIVPADVENAAADNAWLKSAGWGEM